MRLFGKKKESESSDKADALGKELSPQAESEFFNDSTFNDPLAKSDDEDESVIVPPPAVEQEGAVEEEEEEEYVPEPIRPETYDFKKPKKKLKKPKAKDELRMITGVAPSLLGEIKSKVTEINRERKALIKEKEDLEDKFNQTMRRLGSIEGRMKLIESNLSCKDSYDDVLNRLHHVEGKSSTIESTFKNFKTDLLSSFMNEARAVLRQEMKLQSDATTAVHGRVLRIEDELINLHKDFDEVKFMSSFHDYYQNIKFLIFFMTNCESGDHRLITISLQTIRSVIEDMRSNGYWESGRDAIITSLLNLKSYWRGKDERVENLIGVEVDALENLR